MRVTYHAVVDVAGVEEEVDLTVDTSLGPLVVVVATERHGRDAAAVLVFIVNYCPSRLVRVVPMVPAGVGRGTVTSEGGVVVKRTVIGMGRTATDNSLCYSYFST